MEIHAKKVNGRCRVCGRFLVEARDKKKRSTYNCKEFAEDLKSHFCINTSQDILGIHPLSFCYRCKRVMDKHHQPGPQTDCSIPFEWKAHTEVDCMVIKCLSYIEMHWFSYHDLICHPKPPIKTSPTGRPAQESPHKIIAPICSLAPPTLPNFSLASSNNPMILKQLSIVHENCTPLNHWSCHAGYWSAQSVWYICSWHPTALESSAHSAPQTLLWLCHNWSQHHH